MRIDIPFLFATLFSSLAAGLAVPGTEVAVVQPETRSDSAPEELWKRKGGGGGGGKGGGGGGGSGGSGGSGGKGGSGSGSGSGSSGTGRGSSGSNIGGSTKTGSGPGRTYGSTGGYYGGGSTVPYRSGLVSPLGIAPFFLLGASLAFWPGVWLYGASLYHYPYPHTYYNETARQNQTMPVLCGCDPYQECSCEDNNSTDYWQSLVGNGTNYNTSVVNLGVVNGTQTLLLNGTLPNGTTAPGGDEDAFSAAAGLRSLVEAVGFWPMVATVCAAVFLA